MKALVPKKAETMTKEEMKKRSEGEKVMDKIHGIVEEDTAPARTPRRRSNQPRYHEGIFEGTFQGPRMFGQSVISQTIRKPDGVSAKSLPQNHKMYLISKWPFISVL